MPFFVAFLEGIITFVSPCLLPMLPIYISYFAGQSAANQKRSALTNALGFVLGFTLVFTLMGAFAGAIGGFLKSHQAAVNLISGGVVIVFGLNFLGVLKLSLFKGISGGKAVKELGFFSSVTFGAVFSVGWTPCVGAFLGSALMLASQQGSAARGIVMLLCYSLGLGIPFVASALLIDRLGGTFDWIKRHYRTINFISGSFLIVTGILMMTGTMGRLLSLLTF